MPDVQVAVVDFGNVADLRYALQGVDLLISTISGAEQLNLIDAAKRARVRVFVPSEFEGSISHRPATDPLDRGSHAALELLKQCQQSKPNPMQYTVFSCGLFMERFGPGGLQAYNLGASTGVQNSNDYLVDISQAAGEIIETGPNGRPAQVVLTSVYDVARFVAAAIELGPNTWPREFKMRGDQMTVRDLVATCSNVRGGMPLYAYFGIRQDLRLTRPSTVPFTLAVHTYQAAVAQAEYCQQNEEWARWYYFQRLIATANGRYNFRQANLNELVTQGNLMNPRPMRFGEWLETVWGSAL
jgi:hypothetical protein